MGQFPGGEEGKSKYNMDVAYITGAKISSLLDIEQLWELSQSDLSFMTCLKKRPQKTCPC